MVCQSLPTGLPLPREKPCSPAQASRPCASPVPSTDRTGDAAPPSLLHSAVSWMEPHGPLFTRCPKWPSHAAACLAWMCWDE
jgi:hypothetical protein